MDIKKINTTILNEILKNKGNLASTGYMTKDDKTLCCINGHIAFYMDNSDFIIDKTKLPQLQIDKLFSTAKDNAQEVFKTGNSKEFDVGNKTVKILEFENYNFKIYIDEKLYKFLGKTKYRFYAKSPKSPLACVDDNNIVKVIILPTILFNINK